VDQRDLVNNLRLAHNQGKPRGSHLSSSYMGLKLYYQLTSCGSLLDWRCMKKARQIAHDNLNLTQQRKSDATSCSSRLATYKESVVTMTGTFNNVPSTLEIWSFVASRTKPGCTSLIRDWKDHSLCTRLQDQDCIAYSTLMDRRSQTPGISSTYVVFTLS
jgi:hypothetical protein